MDRNSLLQFIEIFVNSNEQKIQLDIFRDSQVILQIYKLEDVKHWGLDIESYIEREFIIELTFSKSKISNSENLKRFEYSEWFKKFVKIDNITENSYWFGINKNIDIKEFEQIIFSLLDSVYEFNDNETVEFTVKAY